MREMTSNVYYLALMTLSYIVGELTHFLINTTSRAVAREIKFGDQSCFKSETNVSGLEISVDCSSLKNETDCVSQSECNWHYNGLGLQYQVRGDVLTLQAHISYSQLMKYNCKPFLVWMTQ